MEIQHKTCVMRVISVSGNAKIFVRSTHSWWNFAQQTEKRTTNIQEDCAGSNQGYRTRTRHAHNPGHATTQMLHDFGNLHPVCCPLQIWNSHIGELLLLVRIWYQFVHWLTKLKVGCSRKRRKCKLRPKEDLFHPTLLRCTLCIEKSVWWILEFHGCKLDCCLQF